jgi:2-methylcitrate dehydratase PrpD
MAAMLARDGFTGPAAVLEGKFGFLNAFCRDRDPQRLTAALGSEWHTLKIMLKRYACHITAHVPVTAVLEMKAQDGIAADEVASITVAGSEKMVSHHNIPEPQDLAMAQYSTPFCVALALHRDPLDPRSFCEQNLNDPAIRATARKVAVELRPSAPDDHAFVTRLTVRLRDGRELTREAQDFPGMPHRPLAGVELRAKFMALAASLGAAPAQRLFEKLENLETLADVADLIAADE